MEATIVQSRHIAGHPTHTPHEGATETGPHDSGVDDEIAPMLVEPTDAAADMQGQGVLFFFFTPNIYFFLRIQRK